MPPLHLKYRPETLDQVVGNKETVMKLKALLERKEDLPHSFLFYGPKGCGKTTMGRILSNMLGVHKQEYYEMNAADYRKLEDARELERAMQFCPMVGERRFWLLDEAHQLTKGAQECLLKPFEEPPEHAFLCLSTTDPQMIKGTLRDRCQCFKLAPLRLNEMVQFLDEIATEEDAEVPEEILKQIAQDSDFTPRTALVMLDSIIDLPVDKMEAALAATTFTENQAIDLCRAIFGGKTEASIMKLLSNMKEEDPEGLRRCLLGYASSIMLGPKSSAAIRQQAYIVMTAFERPTYDTGFPAIVRGCYEALNGVMALKD